jgi:hypothetical protein
MDSSNSINFSRQLGASYSISVSSAPSRSSSSLLFILSSILLLSFLITSLPSSTTATRTEDAITEFPLHYKPLEGTRKIDKDGAVNASALVFNQFNYWILSFDQHEMGYLLTNITTIPRSLHKYVFSLNLVPTICTIETPPLFASSSSSSTFASSSSATFPASSFFSFPSPLAPSPSPSLLSYLLNRIAPPSSLYVTKEEEDGDDSNSAIEGSCDVTCASLECTPFTCPNGDSISIADCANNTWFHDSNYLFFSIL